MPFKDLREYLARLDEIGELTRLSGAHWNLEVGVISEMAFEHQGPALLFENIADYSSECRLVTNLCSTDRRSMLAMGFDLDLAMGEAMARFKERYANYKPIPPLAVSRAPFQAHEYRGADIDLFRFPVPLWHELDGGRYIGTGDCVVFRDPDGGRINVGTYRLEVHDRSTTGIYQGPDNDGAKICRKYWAKGQAAPVAASFGQEPAIFLTASGCLGTPSGMPEYEFAGFVRGEPVEVVEGKVTGLPIPASAEIVIEGEIPPPEVESRNEGPFGEYTGYYMASPVPEPVIRVKALYHRDQPILHGAPPFKPVKGHYSSPFPGRTVTGLWSRLERQGIRILSIRSLGPLAATAIQIRQESEEDVPRLLKAIGDIPSPQRMFVIVDHDVDLDNPKDVLWAIGTRCEPTTGIQVDTVQTEWIFNPALTKDHRLKKGRYPFSRMIINACRPYKLLDQLPPVNLFSEERRAQAWSKWGGKIFSETKRMGL